MSKEKIIDSVIAILTVIVLAGCSKPGDGRDPEPKPTLPAENIITLGLGDNRVVAFYSSAKNEINKTTLDTADIKSHFGNRVQAFIPLKMVINNDSLTITKPFDVMEKYEARWKENMLFYRSLQASEWKAFGLTKNDESYMLNTQYYLIKSSNDIMKSTIIGQNYADTSDLNEIMDEGDVCIQLKINSTFYEAD